jgi:transposase
MCGRLQELNERLRGEVEALRRAASARRRNSPRATLCPPQAVGPQARRRLRHPRPPARSSARRPGHHGGLPACCPGCGSQLAPERVAVQDQEELPPARPLVTRFEVGVGRCRVCGRRVQPPPPSADPRRARRREHPAWSPGGGAGGLATARGWACRSARSRRCSASSASRSPRWGRPGGAKGRPPGAASLPGLGCGRASQSRGRARQDRLAGRWGKAWLWAFVGAQLTVYRIAHGRGFTDAAAILGEGYASVLECDGWAPDRRFEHATNQSCLAHLLRRCRELLSDAVAGQAPPNAVRRILSTRWRCAGAAMLASWRPGGWSPRSKRWRPRWTDWWLGPLATRPTVGCWTTWPASVTTCSPSCGCPACRPPTGAPSTPSAPRWSATRPGAATAPLAECLRPWRSLVVHRPPTRLRRAII